LDFLLWHYRFWSHSPKPPRMIDLGSSLLRRFKQLSDLNDPDEYLSMIEKAVRLTLDTHPDKAALLMILDNLRSYPFGQFSSNKIIEVSQLHPSIPSSLWKRWSIFVEWHGINSLVDWRSYIAILPQVSRPIATVVYYLWVCHIT
jgi:hypothetical protein